MPGVCTDDDDTSLCVAQNLQRLRSKRHLSLDGLARACGVKVARFSVGFGRVLWRHQRSPDDTEFVVCALPLGGWTLDNYTAINSRVDLLRSLRGDGLALVLVTHDLSLLPGTVDEVLVLDGGEVVERGATAQILGAPRHPCTRALRAAVPRLPDA